MTRELLLDTNALIWTVDDDPRLGPIARQQIADAVSQSRIWVSAFSFWEIAVLVRKRRLLLALSPSEWRKAVLRRGFAELSVTGEIAVLAETLPGMHGDPADRIIVATALTHTLPLVTSDHAILGWAGALSSIDSRK